MAEKKPLLIGQSRPLFKPPEFSNPSSVAGSLAELRNFDAAVVAYVVSMEEANAEKEENANAVTRAVALLVAVLLFGAFYFGNMCNWEWYTALYFSWVTLSTIGYGDYTPVNRCPGNSYDKLERCVRACLLGNPCSARTR